MLTAQTGTQNAGNPNQAHDALPAIAGGTKQCPRRTIPMQMAPPPPKAPAPTAHTSGLPSSTTQATQARCGSAAHSASAPTPRQSDKSRCLAKAREGQGREGQGGAGQGCRGEGARVRVGEGPQGRGPGRPAGRGGGEAGAGRKGAQGPLLAPALCAPKATATPASAPAPAQQQQQQPPARAHLSFGASSGSLSSTAPVMRDACPTHNRTRLGAARRSCDHIYSGHARGRKPGRQG